VRPVALPPLTASPNFLTLGTRVQRSNLAMLVSDSARKHPPLEREATALLDGYPALFEASIDRTDEGLARITKV
jgi:hypothetical protein